MKLFRNRTFLALVALFMAAALCFGIAPGISKSSSKQTQIIRVTKTIPEGTAITSGMITTVEVGGYNLPSDVLKTSQSVIGKYTKAELQPGDYILSSKISDKSGSPYLSNLDGKEQAISISIKSFAAGLSGKLQSGDIVSLIVSNYGTGKQTLAPPELKYVRLLAATNSQGIDTDQVTQDKTDKSDLSANNQNIPATLTLLVNAEQATKLVDYSTNGSLYATLVFRGSQEQTQKYLDTQDSYFTQQSSSQASGAESSSGTGGAGTNGQ